MKCTIRTVLSPRAVFGKRAQFRLHASSKEDSRVLQKVGRVLREKALGDFGRIFEGTSKTREQLGIMEELLAYWTLESSEDTLEELEDTLIMADFGPKVALKLIDQIRDKIRDGLIKSGDDVFEELRVSIKDLILNKMNTATMSHHEKNVVTTRPIVWMIVGVNGGGKTTTIGKLAFQLQQKNEKVILAPGDTFRAAGFEQLMKWSERSGAKIGHFEEGKRPSTVLYQTLETAIKEDLDYVICDTSGRLHTNYGLMEELAKCKRTLGKKVDSAPHEVYLVLDGTTGLNMLNQAKEFHETVGLTGLILTKLDGTAKGGAVISVMDELNLPVKYIGVGEGIDDLLPFNPESFIDALLPRNNK
eukprot:g3259.t1